jgi:hypothetical protein
VNRPGRSLNSARCWPRLPAHVQSGPAANTLGEASGIAAGAGGLRQLDFRGHPNGSLSATRTKQFVIDGEVVVLGVNGISDFEALYSHKHDDEAQLYAFDVLAMDGEDLRRLPLSTA